MAALLRDMNNPVEVGLRTICCYDGGWARVNAIPFPKGDAHAHDPPVFMRLQRTVLSEQWRHLISATNPPKEATAFPVLAPALPQRPKLAGKSIAATLSPQ